MPGLKIGLQQLLLPKPSMQCGGLGTSINTLGLRLRRHAVTNSSMRSTAWSLESSLSIIAVDFNSAQAYIHSRHTNSVGHCFAAMAEQSPYLRILFCRQLPQCCRRIGASRCTCSLSVGAVTQQSSHLQPKASAVVEPQLQQAAVGLNLSPAASTRHSHSARSRCREYPGVPQAINFRSEWQPPIQRTMWAAMGICQAATCLRRQDPEQCDHRSIRC